MAPKLTPDQRIARLAERHHGLVTRAAAIACGLTDRQISGRLRAGRWEPVGPGVYRIAGAPRTPAGRTYAAVLRAGGDAVACGLSALALLEAGTAPTTPTICVPPSASARTSGAIVRRSPLADLDRTRVGPVPCTTPARALLEAAAIVDATRLASLVDEVLDRRLSTPSRVTGAIRRSALGSGREGVQVLRDAMAPWLEGVAPGSPAEVRLLRRLVDDGFPPPVKQHPVHLPGGATAFLDLAWPWANAGLEYDGRRWHGPRRLAHDVAREEAVRRLGWWIGRVDCDDLRPSSTRLRDELRVRLVRSAA